MGMGYCIKCKKKTAILQGQQSYYKNGTPVEKGICSICGSKVTRIFTKEERQALKDRQPQEQTDGSSDIQ